MKMEHKLITLELPKPSSKDTKREMLIKTYSKLFEEHLKAKLLILLQLHKKECCTWNEIFEGSGLKEMGVSTSTVSRILKQLEEKGIVKKEKAPFPIKVKYCLTYPDPDITSVLQRIENYLPQLQEVYLQITAKEAVRLFRVLIECFKEGNEEKTVLNIFLFLHILLHLVVNVTPEMEARFLNQLEEELDNFLNKIRFL